MLRISMLCAALLLAGCTTTKGSYCLYGPQRPSQATIDAMTDAEVDEALKRLELGAKLCGWKP